MMGEEGTTGTETEIGSEEKSGNVIGLAADGERKKRQKKVCGAGLESGFRLTERDYDVLQFIYEQQFAGLAAIYFRFFDRRRQATDLVPQNFWVTRQRVAILRQAGLIRSEKVFTDSKALYLLTRLGHDLLKSRRELVFDAPPTEKVDFRYFEHDRRVTMCRIALERDDKVMKWYPDRMLRLKKAIPNESGQGWLKLSAGVIPDGIFLSSKQERIAFEFELTPKKRERYEAKWGEYLGLFRGSKFHQTRASVEQVGPPTIHRVMMVAATDRIGKDLQEIFKSTDRVMVRSFESVVGGILGKEALVGL